MRSAVDPREAGWSAGRLLAAACACGGFAMLAVVLAQVPREPGPLGGLVAANLEETGLGNPITAVLMNYRAVDTMLEKALLVLAVVALWGLAPRASWRTPGGNFVTPRPPEPQLTVLLKALVPLVTLSAVYLFWQGSDAPGGAFQAGTMLAGVAILLVLGGVLPAPGSGTGWLRGVMVVGVIAFAVTGLGTWLGGRAFLDYPPALAKHLVLAVELALMSAVAVSLFLLASGVPASDADADATGTDAPS